MPPAITITSVFRVDYPELNDVGLTGLAARQLVDDVTAAITNVMRVYVCGEM